MAVQFIIDDGLSGRLYVKRQGDDKVAFSTIGGSECWASTDDVKKLMAELGELVRNIEAQAS